MYLAPTTLVLGAGASVHAGYPLGRRLRNRIIENLEHPSDGKISRFLEANWDKAKREQFRLGLSRANYTSVDAYLEAHPEHLDIGKFMIAWWLKSCEDYHNLFPEPGWYEEIARRLIPGTEPPDLASSRLRVVTFNYDRSLEYYLHETLMHRCGLTPAEATHVLNGLPIEHVHGILGAYPEVTYTRSMEMKSLLAMSSQIQIVSEVQDSEADSPPTPGFIRAKRMLEQSERIYFLGFGFHPPNLRRFRFFTSEAIKDKIVKGTTSGIEGPVIRAELFSRLAEFGLGDETAFPGVDCKQFFSYVEPL